MSLFRRSGAKPSPTGPAEGLLQPSRPKGHLRSLFSRSKSPSPSPSPLPSPSPAPRPGQTDNEAKLAANHSQEQHDSPTAPGTSPKPASSGPPVATSKAMPQVTVAEVLPTEVPPVEVPAVKVPAVEVIAAKVTAAKVTVAEPPPDVEDDSTVPADLPGSAYQQALASFSQDDKKKLMSQETIRRLFAQLNEADLAHQEHSLLRKGLRRVKPYLEFLNVTIDFVSPFASVEPTAGTALSVVKTAASVVVAMCGRFDDMTNDIATFLERIPAIDRCSSVVRGGGPLFDIHKALVDVYKDLLQFYLKTEPLFDKRKFALGVALEMLRPQVADIISSFKTHAALLSSLLETESFASIQEIKDEQVDTLVRDVLDRSQDYHGSYYSDLEDRADEACSWLTSDDAFSYWLLSRDSNVLALFGDMGAGKTMTTAFVVKSLETGRVKSPERGHLLCSYYFKDERELAKLETIYRSILLQLVNQSFEIKMRFSRWYKEKKHATGKDPTQLALSLSELLYDIISSSRDLVFLVVDALDECESGSRKLLLNLFQRLLKDKAPLKVFVSSRYNEAIEADLPSKFTRIELRPSYDRDRTIATHLVKQTDIDPGLQENVVERLASLACGSAIWLRLAVQYIKGITIKSSRGLEKVLGQLPSSKDLVKLYGKLFDRVCGGELVNETQLQRALDILAVSRRPLTLEELDYAVFTVNPADEDEEDPTTLAELTELAQGVSVSRLVRPFVTEVGGRGGKRPHLRLVHQSLRELLLTAPPLDWGVARTVAKRKKGERAADLNADLLQRCIQYLLLEEFGKQSLFPDSSLDDSGAELFTVGALLDDDEADDAQTMTDTTASNSNPSSDLGVSEAAGFGSFYAYAAANWTGHFSDVSPQRLPDSQQLIELCRKGSRRLENWVEQWRRPSNRYVPELEFPGFMNELDPFVITVMFGPPASVIDMLRLNLDSSIITESSAWTAGLFLSRCGRMPMLKSLILDEAVGPMLCRCEFLYVIIEDWVGWKEPDAAESRSWEEIFAFLIPHLRDEILPHANFVLRRAARSGCLLLIKQLFAAAQNDADLWQSLLTLHKNPPPSERALLNVHQSIGEAAHMGYPDTVRFLCEQLGLESHLHHVSPTTGDTVFHMAVRRPREEILRTLIRHWPEGVDVPRHDGATPLDMLLFNSSGPNEHAIIPCVRILLHEGKASAGACGEFSLLRTAVRGGYYDVLRILVVEGGADVLEVVDIDEATGRPSLKKGADTWNDEKKRERMLQVLCSLLPLAVSTEYLFGEE